MTLRTFYSEKWQKEADREKKRGNSKWNRKMEGGKKKRKRIKGNRPEPLPKLSIEGKKDKSISSKNVLRCFGLSKCSFKRRSKELEGIKMLRREAQKAWLRINRKQFHFREKS
ncbi:hypothetical protein TNIN_367481 [Trichonephila inaurata madagascariensis]|uniref:Uncharacterized protein n=1 Tax=Trichonephila inaurata madagascariensis TaxID=2747483 RepID=A0A8X7BVD3_9ARAC|nr:hypothetical protein TNIN_367481 [Trichonephila inaurata madagascariensis]